MTKNRKDCFKTKAICLILITGGFFVCPFFVFGATNSLVINEIQIDSIDGDGGSNDDFIELYNPATSSINLSGFQLKKRSSTGSESSVRLFPTGSIISAQNYFSCSCL